MTLPAPYYQQEIQHLLEVAPSIDEKERAAFMTQYLEGILQPIDELLEAMAEEDMPACSACGHFDMPGACCGRCGVCQSCLEHADDCTCSEPASERFQVASASAWSFSD